MSTYYLRNTTERPSLLKRIIGAVLPLALKRHFLYVKHFKRLGNFRDPQLFSEKMQWRIIRDRRDILRSTCDKRASKVAAARAASEAGIDLLTPRQLAWSASADPFIADLRAKYDQGALPDRWVMKPNHSSGRALLVEGVPEWELLIEAARAWLRPSRFLGLHWIWPYATAEAGLLAEEFIPGKEPPIEWQLWMFNGEIEFIAVQQRANRRLMRSCFNRNWELIPTWYNHEAEPLATQTPPVHWKEIARAAKALGGGWDMIRIDLYEDDRGGVWFNEITPYPTEGLINQTEGARTFDTLAGAAWPLPSLSSEDHQSR